MSCGQKCEVFEKSTLKKKEIESIMLLSLAQNGRLFPGIILYHIIAILK